MENLKTHILFVCPDCNDIKIVRRAEHDDKKSVYAYMPCPKHPPEDFQVPVYEREYKPKPRTKKK